MSFKVNCPHCTRMLNVTEPAFGKTVPCPGCGQPFKVPYPPEPARQASPVGGPQAWSGAVQNRGATSDRAAPLPAGMPPLPPANDVPPADGGLDFLNESADRSVGPKAWAEAAARGLNLTDMFLGNEKEHVFSLLPGEQRLDELTIDHQHFFIVKSGVERLALTTHRLLYTETRVFSPLYWLLLVLFPPLIFYYAVRVSRNRNVALPLGSVDSVMAQARGRRG